MHSIKERAVVVNGQIVIRPIMVIALTYDHRLLDGREAVTFLGTYLVLQAENFDSHRLIYSQGPRLLRGPSQDAPSIKFCLNHKQFCRVYLIFEHSCYALNSSFSANVTQARPTKLTTLIDDTTDRVSLVILIQLLLLLQHIEFIEIHRDSRSYSKPTDHGLMLSVDATVYGTYVVFTSPSTDSSVKFNQRCLEQGDDSHTYSALEAIHNPDCFWSASQGGRPK